MQAKIIYTVVFLLAFALTTGAMIFLNNKYENIFKFNFAPAAIVSKVVQAEGKKEKPEEEKNQASPQVAENPAAGDNKNNAASDVAQQVQKDQDQTNRSVPLDSLNKMKVALDQAKKSLSEKERELQNSKSVSKARQDSAYTKWKSDMVKTYDKMDPKSVAKILINMNDNYARDILFSFKDKKRAQIIETILSINPEAASRLTRTP